MIRHDTRDTQDTLKALLRIFERRYEELTAQALSPALEPAKRQAIQKELSYVQTVLNKYKELEGITCQIAALETQRAVETDSAMLSLYDEELVALRLLLAQEYQELDELLYPADPLDNRSVFLEIRAGAGGQEASLFAADLLRMYTNYALKQNWRVSIASSSSTDLGGYREIIVHIEGKNVYGHLKHESGVHRVQRVPVTETSGRIHTSTATVAVLPEAEEVDVVINPVDLRIDVYRSSGAGGQHVNTTDSAVRITHIPTGVVVACQDERSQHKNKAKALKMLQSRLLATHKEKQEAQVSQKRKELVGTGERAEKVRTYNFPQNRVTDHQAEITLKKLDMVLEGNLDDIIDALRTKEREQRRTQPRFVTLS
jgi:peptide chain release factor 1